MPGNGGRLRRALDATRGSGAGLSFFADRSTLRAVGSISRLAARRSGRGRMRQIGDRRLRWRRAHFVGEYLEAATWQQRATLCAAVVGGLTCAYLVVHLLGLEIRVPGLAAPDRTPAFVPAPRAARQPVALRSRSHAPAARPASKPARARVVRVARSRPLPAPQAGAETSVAQAPEAEAPVSPPPPPPAPRPGPQPPPTGAGAEPALAAAVVPPAPPPPAVSPPALPPLPQVQVPSVEVPPVPSVPLPTVP